MKNPLIMKNSIVNHSGFRVDINGLRAYAVVFVLLYHFGVPGFGGGFVGVDVFFVISGYLMTKMIALGLAKDGFSIFEFYLARLRRIFPALAFLSAVLIVIGFFIMPMAEYKKLSSHIVYSLIFISNVEYWKESGYFDLASHDKWLLHTWSLSVEWQFYLILPIVMVLGWKIAGKRFVFFVLVFFLLSSFGLSLWITPIDSSASFFLLHTRAWEMLAGGLLAMSSRQDIKSPKSAEFFGVVLILIGVLYIGDGGAWPGWRAVFPVSGACLIIYASRQKSLITGNVLAQYLGNISYSLYLWHWPIVVFLGYLGYLYTPFGIAIGLFLSVVLGGLSYRYVETPIRVGLAKVRSIGQIFRQGLVFVVVAVSAIYIHKFGGVSGRLSEQVEIASQESENFNPRREECHISNGVESPECVYNIGDKVGAIVIGDSHANALVTSVAETFHKDGYGVMELSYSGCPTIRGVVKLNPPASAKDYACKEFNEWLLNGLANHWDKSLPVVIINRLSVSVFGPSEPWLDKKGEPGVYFTKQFVSPDPEFLAEFRERFVDTICEISLHRDVYILRPIPEMPFNIPRTISHRMAFGMIDDVAISLEDYHARHKFVWDIQDVASQRCGAKILNPLPFLCDNSRCYGSKNGVPLYYDDDHLSEQGNKHLMPMFEKVFSGV